MSSNRALASLTESQLTKIWQHQLLDQAGLATEDGEPIAVVYPGRLNDERGADFRDAVITIGGRLTRGDVEIHVKSGGWQGHRHHLDVAYNRVVLHVVMWNNARTPTRLQNGKEVPVLALENFIKTPVTRLLQSVTSSVNYNIASGQSAGAEKSPITKNIPCLKVGRRRGMGAVTEILVRAGEARFLTRAAAFRKDLTRMEAGQSLYRRIMEALGYSRNKLPFLELARRLPLQVLESVTQNNLSENEFLIGQQARLLGTAGLLSAPRLNCCPGDGWTEELEKLWSACHRARAMSPDVWQLFKVRPNNSPFLRLLAMSYLLFRYREEGFCKGLVSLVEVTPVERGFKKLERGLQITIDGYGTDRADSRLVSRRRGLTLLGRGRAADIVVNVLLPFVFAWGQAVSRPETVEKAFDLYRSYPKLAVNSLEKHMAEQLGLSSLVDSARRQQGLIHIYKTLCTFGRCGKCPLSQLEAGNNVQV